MSNDKPALFPVSLDLGAKSTGVYYGQYSEGARFDKIQKRGEVLLYDSKNYTILLKDRTAKRHQRRGYDRLQFAKRLFVLILENYFQFSTKEHHGAIGFLMNRRGFSYLDKDYSPKYLNQLKEEEKLKKIWDILPCRFRKELKEPEENISDRIDTLTNDEPDTIKEMNDLLETEVSKIKKELVYYGFLKNLKDATSPEKSDPSSNKNKIGEWILKRAIKEGVKISETLLEENKDSSVDIAAYLSRLSEKGKNELFHSIPDAHQKPDKLKSSVWNQKISNFDLEKEQKILDNKDHEDYVKTHLKHLCFAFSKINHEIISGGRHRSKFFEEIEDDLEKMKDHPFLHFRKFGQSIETHQKLTMEKLHSILCHISNFELKPLRAYFNDEKHKQGDQWDLGRLTKLGSRWFLENWHVSEEKDGKKKKEAYDELRRLWKEHLNQNDIVDFWMAVDPVLTIPPYQNMKNRRPPKCQTLILNPDYMEKHYKDWEHWLAALKEGKREFFGGYSEKLQQLESVKEAHC